MRSSVLVLLMVLLAGCATVPETPTPTSTTSATAPTPIPSPPGPEPAATTLLHEGFLAQPSQVEWIQGFWDAQRPLAGTHAIEAGGLALRVPPSGPAAHGLGRILDVSDGATTITATAVVTATSLDRYGLYLNSPSGWLGLEMDHEGFCLCGMDSQGQRVKMVETTIQKGTPHTLELSVNAAGEATARVTRLGEPIGVFSAQTGIRAPEVAQLWLAVWDSPFATERSDYTTRSVTVSQVVEAR